MTIRSGMQLIFKLFWTAVTKTVLMVDWCPFCSLYIKTSSVAVLFQVSHANFCHFFSSKYGNLNVDVEEGKKENRSKELFSMPFSKFLKTYNESDVYLVQSLPKIMRGN